MDEEEDEGHQKGTKEWDRINLSKNDERIKKKSGRGRKEKKTT